MNSHKGIVIVLFIALCLMSSYAQKHKDRPVFKYSGHDFSRTVDSLISQRNTLQKYVANHLTKDFSRLDSVCYEGISLVRFKLKKGKIIELECSVNTPASISLVLLEYVKKSEKYWRGDTLEEQYIALPVRYSFIYGCGKETIKNTADNAFVFTFDLKEDSTYYNYIFLEGVNWDSGVPDF